MLIRAEAPLTLDLVHLFLRSLAALSLAALGCSNVLSFDVNVGPFGFDVDASRAVLPPAWQQSSRVATVSCASSPCPALTMPGAPIVRCVSGVCDPDPFVFDLSLPSVIDATAYSAQLSALGNQFTRISVARLSWHAIASGLNAPLGATTLFWGPESATAPNAPGVHALGVIPAVRFAPDGTAAGDLSLDPVGAEALSSHLLHASRRFRLFARPSIDLAPGAALPAGRASISVVIGLRVEGQLIQ